MIGTNDDALYLNEYPENASVVTIANSILNTFASKDEFILSVGRLIRKSISEVIDMDRTGRWSIDHIEKTEKTYIGTKVEILFRHELDLTKGDTLDLKIDNFDVDVKFTIGNNWMIPTEAIGKHCVLLSGSDKESIFSIGIFKADTKYLTNRANKDGKKSVSSLGKKSIYWLAKQSPMPNNFFYDLDAKTRDYILSGKNGSERVRRLFINLPGVVIHRDVICGLARQKDPLKRTRKNGGARDKLQKLGFILLSGKYNRNILNKLGFGKISNDEAISFNIKQLEENGLKEIVDEYFSS